mmetsp:Transcript_22764/g.34240  ORF Transcript_22764/g.34240 Transcript_22764/m.34240 type:complete len:81 (+) Transcript_22764:903-1145(+)
MVQRAEFGAGISTSGVGGGVVWGPPVPDGVCGVYIVGIGAQNGDGPKSNLATIKGHPNAGGHGSDDCKGQQRPAQSASIP